MKAKFLIPFSALLLMGSSGCLESDASTVTDFLEILGGSQGIGAADVIEHSVGGTNEDPGKEALLQTGDTMKNIEMARELENEAEALLNQKPPDQKAAREKLAEAHKLRPNDWSLINQNGVLSAEQGNDQTGDEFKGISAACRAIMPNNRARCAKSVVDERLDLLNASVERQKRTQSLVNCATYAMRSSTLRSMMKLGPDSKTPLYTQEQIEAYREAAFEVEAFLSRPGQTCAGQLHAPDLPPPV